MTLPVQTNEMRKKKTPYSAPFNMQQMFKEVSKRPALWQPHHADFNNRFIRAELWRDIAIQLLPDFCTAKDKVRLVAMVASRWKTSRNGLLRNLRTRHTYIYHNEMSFLVPILQETLNQEAKAKEVRVRFRANSEDSAKTLPPAQPASRGRPRKQTDYFVPPMHLRLRSTAPDTVWETVQPKRITITTTTTPTVSNTTTTTTSVTSKTTTPATTTTTTVLLPRSTTITTGPSNTAKPTTFPCKTISILIRPPAKPTAALAAEPGAAPPPAVTSTTATNTAKLSTLPARSPPKILRFGPTTTTTPTSPLRSTRSIKLAPPTPPSSSTTETTTTTTTATTSTPTDEPTESTEPTVAQELLEPDEEPMDEDMFAKEEIISICSDLSDELDVKLLASAQFSNLQSEYTDPTSNMTPPQTVVHAYDYRHTPTSQTNEEFQSLLTNRASNNEATISSSASAAAPNAASAAATDNHMSMHSDSGCGSSTSSGVVSLALRDISAAVAAASDAETTCMGDLRGFCNSGSVGVGETSNSSLNSLATPIAAPPSEAPSCSSVSGPDTRYSLGSGFGLGPGSYGGGPVISGCRGSASMGGSTSANGHDPDQAFFDSIKPIIRNWSVDKKLDFQFEVLSLLKTFRSQ